MVGKIALILSLVINLLLVGYIICYMPSCTEKNKKGGSTVSSQVIGEAAAEKGSKKNRSLPEMSKVSEYRGKLVSISDADTSLLVFIALDCPGCIDVLGITGKLRPSDNIVQHLVVRNEESIEAVRKYLTSHGVDLPFVLDRDSKNIGRLQDSRYSRSGYRYRF